MTQEDIQSFCEEQENENSRRKIFYDIKIFLEFLQSENEARNIHEIPPNELNYIPSETAKSTNQVLLERFYKVSTVVFVKMFAHYHY